MGARCVSYSLSAFLKWFVEDRRNTLALAASLIPAGILFYFIRNHGLSHIPVADQWFLSLYLAIKVKQGYLGVADIFVKYGAHRVVFYNLYAIAQTYFTNFR